MEIENERKVKQQTVAFLQPIDVEGVLLSLSIMVRGKLLDKSKKTKRNAKACIRIQRCSFLRSEQMSLTVRVDVHIQLRCVRKRYQWELRNTV